MWNIETWSHVDLFAMISAVGLVLRTVGTVLLTGLGLLVTIFVTFFPAGKRSSGYKGIHDDQ